MANRGRRRKKKDNKMHPKVTIYDANLSCYVTYYIDNGKLKVENDKPR